MNPKIWWNKMSVEDRLKILEEVFADFFRSELATRTWELLGKVDQAALATYHSNHLGTINIEVQSWVKKDDSRPKKKYCSCGTLLRPNGSCWRCSGLAGVSK